MRGGPHTNRQADVSGHYVPTLRLAAGARRVAAYRGRVLVATIKPARVLVEGFF
jgi:hypothetical protein